MTVLIIQGDCIEAMKTLEACSVDAVCTDPPYGIRFMGKAWDGADIERRAAARRACPSKHERSGPNGGHRSEAAEAGKYDLSPAAMLAFQQFSADWAREAFRVLKPGGHLLSFASTRTYHRMACGVEEAGFEIRDQLAWMFGTGFPKSHNLGGDWQGWGTALKPAWEPIVLARKPLVGTVAANVLEHGTGALNIDGCRVSGGYETRERDTTGGASMFGLGAGGGAFVAAEGRWPANILHDGSDEVLAAFPDAPGQKADVTGNEPSEKTAGIFGPMKRAGEASADSENAGAVGFKMKPGARRGDTGSAARFFWSPKTSSAERHEGLEHPGHQFAIGRMPHDAEQVNAGKRGNHHPTVKPVDVMRYLCRLITPPGGTVLDPFMGSGSTLKAAELEGFSAIGIELDPEYVEIARRRIAADAPLFADVKVER